MSSSIFQSRKVFSIAHSISCTLFLLLLIGMNIDATAAPIIVDHTATDITAIPQNALQRAKDNLRIAYGHTSHGRQLITGMNSLVSFANNGGKGLSLPQNFFRWNGGGTEGALDLRDQPFSNASDLGDPNRTAWAGATRNYLNQHPEVNVVIWSWCGQVSSATEANINTYLNLMNGLETDYPDVKFVYMTGHLDGSGLNGNLHLRNEQIRQYCRINDKILYDFADIESYDPDGHINYNELRATDHCDYDSNGDGLRDRNWAIDWQNSHTRDVDWYSCSSAHSQALNANQKAYAAWWLWARLAGWGECAPAPEGLTAVADSDAGRITLNWTNSSDNINSFIVQRRVDNDPWNNTYQTVPANLTTFEDTGLAPGTYHYRVVAHRNDDGTGTPCDSGHSNTVQANLINPDLPIAPSELSAIADSIAGTITLRWTDNSDNENEFVIQRQVNGDDWNETYNTVGANVYTFVDSGLSSGSYRYRVIATNSHGQSNPSNEASANIVQSVPEAPSDLTSTVNGFSITLSWTNNSNSVDSFVVERRTDGGEYTVIANDLPDDETTFTDSNLTPLHTYTYRVMAVNSFGNSAYSNETEQYIHEETITITLNNPASGEVIDAFMNSASPDSNYGNTTYSTAYDRFIVRFNLPADVMNKQIVSAQVSFFIWAVAPGDAGTALDLYRVSQPWEEETVTWNRANADTVWDTAGGTIGESVGSVVVENLDHEFLTPVNVTDIVQQWVDGRVDNYGLILDKGRDVSMGIKASEYRQSAAPYLSITYTNKVCGDHDSDGDVDGVDLYEYTETFSSSCLSSFASAFGH